MAILRLQPPPHHLARQLRQFVRAGISASREGTDPISQSAQDAKTNPDGAQRTPEFRVFVLWPIVKKLKNIKTPGNQTCDGATSTMRIFPDIRPMALGAGGQRPQFGGGTVKIAVLRVEIISPMRVFYEDILAAGSAL